MRFGSQGFNEPDWADQANMTPALAAQLWKSHLQPLKTKYGVRLGLPAVTSAPSGRPWLRQFLALCTGCQYDFLPLVSPVTLFHERRLRGSLALVWRRSWEFL